MGIYLSQLPPAEFARLKAELAETLVANFCYPRFFDHRIGTLRTRPVDRAKRQDVWLYLSSFDFTAWNRLDLTSPDFQHYIEGLFIQFVQRNRSFFGEQGRKRMSDIRILINSSATSVVQGLRSHITGQKQGNPPFGSPRPVASWSTPNVYSRQELTWEQISANTMLLQQQLQEMRGEVKPALADGRSSNGNSRRRTRSQPLAGSDYDDIQHTPTIATPQVNGHAAASMSRSTSSTLSAGSPPAVRKSTPLSAPNEVPKPASPPTKPPVSSPLPAPTISTAPARSVSQPASPAPGQREMLAISEDDVAIFEQMRHQLLVWLRVEAVHSGIDISGQSPFQLLEALRQQAKMDETRLQVVSTLLNLSNQIIKTGIVSILDYKQALMFHLMHTRR